MAVSSVHLRSSRYAVSLPLEKMSFSCLSGTGSVLQDLSPALLLWSGFEVYSLGSYSQCCI